MSATDILVLVDGVLFLIWLAMTWIHPRTATGALVWLISAVWVVVSMLSDLLALSIVHTVGLLVLLAIIPTTYAEARDIAKAARR